MATYQQEKKDLGSQAAGMADKAKEAATDASSKVREAATSAAQKVGEAASFVGQKAQDAATSVGSGMKSLSGTIREHTPSSGMLGTAGGAVADTLESSGRYLQEHGLSGIGEDLTRLIRRNPIPAVLLGIGIGFLFARATTRS